MNIDVLFIEGCPNYVPTMERIREALRAVAKSGEVRHIEVRTRADAEALRFVGSPTIRVNGVDIEPWARAAQTFGIGCRTYLDGSQLSGIPPLDLLCRAIESQ
jgi:hypothetical protein